MKMVDIRDDKDVMMMLSYLGFRTRVIDIYIVGGAQSGLLIGESGVGKGVSEPGVGDHGVGQSGVGNGASETGMGKHGVGQPGVGESDGESESYNPSSHGEDETNDDMSADELVPADEEYTQAREKLKTRSIRDVSDDLYKGNTGENNGITEYGHSDYEESDEDEVSDSTYEDDESARRIERHKRRVYDPRCDHKTLKLTLGMRFVDGYQVRDALTDNAIENGWEIHFKRANKEKVQASCKEPCTWKCYGSRIKKNGAFVIKTLYDVHTCPRNMKSKIVTSNWIARKYLNVFRLRPDTSVKELQRDLVQRFAHDASRWKLYKAKKKIIELLTGSVADHYAKLRSYVLELMRVDKERRILPDRTSFANHV